MYPISTRKFGLPGLLFIFCERRSTQLRVCFFFFFSSRRRHTRSLCDWSSDVCSSDLMNSPATKSVFGGAFSLRTTDGHTLGRGAIHPNAIAARLRPRGVAPSYRFARAA